MPRPASIQFSTTSVLSFRNFFCVEEAGISPWNRNEPARAPRPHPYSSHPFGLLSYLRPRNSRSQHNHDRRASATASHTTSNPSLLDTATPPSRSLSTPSRSFSHHSQALRLGGRSPEHLLWPNSRPASTFCGDRLGNSNGNGNGNGDDNNPVSAGVHGGGGGAAAARLQPDTVYGGGAAVPLPVLGVGGGYLGKQALAAASREGGRSLGAARSATSFLDILDCFVLENDGAALHAPFSSSADNQPSGSPGGVGGGGGSFRGGLPTGLLYRGELGWMQDICEAVRVLVWVLRPFWYAHLLHRCKLWCTHASRGWSCGCMLVGRCARCLKLVVCYGMRAHLCLRCRFFMLIC